MSDYKLLKLILEQLRSGIPITSTQGAGTVDSHTSRVTIGTNDVVSSGIVNLANNIKSYGSILNTAAFRVCHADGSGVTIPFHSLRDNHGGTNETQVIWVADDCTIIASLATKLDTMNVTLDTLGDISSKLDTLNASLSSIDNNLVLISGKLDTVNTVLADVHVGGTHSIKTST